MFSIPRCKKARLIGDVQYARKYDNTRELLTLILDQLTAACIITTGRTRLSSEAQSLSVAWVGAEKVQILSADDW